MCSHKTPDCPYTLTKNLLISFGRNFNDDLDAYYCIMKDLRIVMLGDQFTKYITFLPKQLECLVYGSRFNNFPYLTKNLCSLRFDYMFNRVISLTKKLCGVIFGKCFNQCVVLPKNLKRVIFGDCFASPIELAKKLLSLSFGDNYNSIVKFPKRIRDVVLGYNFNQTIILTKHLRELLVRTISNCNIVFEESPQCLRNMYDHKNFMSDYMSNCIEAYGSDIYDVQMPVNLPNSIRFIV